MGINMHPSLSEYSCLFFDTTYESLSLSLPFGLLFLALQV